MRRVRHQEKGFILYWSLALSGILATIALLLIGGSSMMSQSVANSLQKEKTQVVAENLLHMTLNLLRSTLQQNLTIDSATVTSQLNTTITPYVPSGYSIVSLSVQILSANAFLAQIPAGPFRGLQSQNTPVTLDLVLQHQASRTTAKLDLSAYIGTIYPTQFNFFSFAGLFNLNLVSQIRTSGRVFTNEGITIGNLGNPFSVDFLTTANYLNMWDGYPAQIANTPNPMAPSDYTQVPIPWTNDCSNCFNSGLGFYEWSLNTWGGQFQDMHYGVQVLDYWFGDQNVLGIPKANRVLDGTEAFWIGFQADIRVINGVWYLKNPANITDWPGLPIWSDHPGSYQTLNEDGQEGTQRVGQSDIPLNLASKGLANAWPVGTMPQYFSYYKADPTTGILNINSLQGTVSYGNLVQTAPNGAPGNWLPGDYVGDPLCGAQPGPKCTNCGFLPPVAPTKSLTNFTPMCQDAGGAPLPSPDVASRLLNATRSGFKFGIPEYWAIDHSSAAKIWPMNFDLSLFQKALQCPAGTHPGELGCYFGGATSYMKRPFNGIVYINNTWQSQTGYIPWPYMQNDPQRSPIFQGLTNSDPAQPAPISGAVSSVQNGILPMQLCSTSFANQSYDTSGLFTIPDCAHYHLPGGQFAARTNGLRIINGGIDPTKFPKGLTIYSPVTIYATGDINANSVVTSAGATPWTPVFLASSQVVPLSNAWNDSSAPWDQATTAIFRQAANTTQIMASTFPSNTFGPFFNEVWSGVNYQKNGGNIAFPNLMGTNGLGFYWTPDYSTTGILLYPGTYLNPNIMNFLEDPHYQLFANQPPGFSPVTILSINSWNKLTHDSSLARGSQ